MRIVSLTVSMDPRLPLRLLILVVAGSLQLRTTKALELCPTSMPTLKEMYIQWVLRFFPSISQHQRPLAQQTLSHGRG